MKKYRVLTYLIFGLLGATIFWYFGHHRPTQKILKTESKKVYSSATPSAHERIPSLRNRAQPTHPHTIEDDTHQKSSVSGTEHDGTSLSPKQNDLRENTETKEDTIISLDSEAAIHTHTPSKEEQEARQKRKANIENELEQIQKESVEILRKAMPMIVDHLNTLPLAKQRAFLKETKTAMFNQIQQIPEFEYLRDNSEFIEKGWKTYLEMLAENGYALPKGIE